LLAGVAFAFALVAFLGNLDLLRRGAQGWGQAFDRLVLSAAIAILAVAFLLAVRKYHGRD